ncbi:hypothetical protein [Actinophytocola sediminis]
MPAGVSERLVRRAGLAVRAISLLVCALAVSLTLDRFPAPWHGPALLAVLVAETAALAAHWARHGTVRGAFVVVDLVVVGAVVVANGLLVDEPGTMAYFAGNYAMMAAFSVGLSARRLGRAYAVVSCWVAATVAVLVWRHGQPVPAAAIAVFQLAVNPVAGWLSARLLRRTTAELAEVDDVAARRAEEAAVRQVRAHAAAALHDRVLQTLETIGRGHQVTDPVLRQRVRDEAGWLRGFVEADGEHAGAGLTAGLDAVAARAGLRVTVNHAAFRPPAAVVDEPVREALLTATGRVLAAMSAVAAEATVRAVPADGGVLVTVLAACAGETALDLTEAGDLLAAAGGRLLAEPDPYVELWVPGAGAP